MPIVLVEVIDAPDAADVRRTVNAFRRANPDVLKTTLHTHRSDEDRALAAALGVRRRPGFLFTDDEGTTLARVRGTTARALLTALARARASDSKPSAVRSTRRSRSRFVAENVGCVSQERRNIAIEGLDPAFAPTSKGLRALGCVSWLRDERGRVTATFATIRAAERAFNRLTNDDPLRMDRAMPDDVAWMNDRMNR